MTTTTQSTLVKNIIKSFDEAAKLPERLDELVKQVAKSKRITAMSEAAIVKLYESDSKISEGRKEKLDDLHNTVVAMILASAKKWEGEVKAACKAADVDALWKVSQDTIKARRKTKGYMPQPYNMLSELSRSMVRCGFLRQRPSMVTAKGCGSLVAASDIAEKKAIKEKNEKIIAGDSTVDWAAFLAKVPEEAIREFVKRLDKKAKKEKK